MSPRLPGVELVGASRYVGEGVEGAGDSQSRLIILPGRSAESEVGFWYSPQFSIKSRNTFHKWRKIANKKHHSNKRGVACVC